MKFTHPKLLVTVERIGEHYWVVLSIRLSIALRTGAYGFFYENNSFIVGSIIGAVLFVFAPPAILMSSYLLLPCMRK